MTGISNLGDSLGVQFCPGEKTGGEEKGDEAEVEEVEMGGRQRGDKRNVSRDEEHGQEKGEESDTSEDDYSSMEGDNLKPRTLDREKREETNQIENKNKENFSRGPVGAPSVPQVDGGHKKTASDEIALTKPSQGDDEKTELFDVTSL